MARLVRFHVIIYYYSIVFYAINARTFAVDVFCAG